MARVRVVLGWGLPLLLVLSGYAAARAWSDAAPPGPPELLAALEHRFGAEPPSDAPLEERLRAVAERWSLKEPHRMVRIREWEYRLRLERFDAPDADEEKVLHFVCFVDNRRVETGWPNGVFYDWGVYARPAGPIARLRRRWS